MKKEEKQLKICLCTPILDEIDSLLEFSEYSEKLNQRDLEVHLTFLFITDQKSSQIVIDQLESLCSHKKSFIQHIHLKTTNGPVSCYLAGYKNALKGTFSYIGDIDAGGSHEVNEIDQFIKKIHSSNLDAIFGSRFLTKGSFINVSPKRIAISKLATLTTSILYSHSLTDLSSGFKIIKSEHVRRIIDYQYPIGGAWQLAMKLHLIKLNVTEVPIKYSGSTSSFKIKWIFKALQFLILSKSIKGLKIVPIERPL